MQADGSVASNGFRGSIHSVGARLLETAGCNGWSAWHYAINSEFRPIDELRQKARQMLAIDSSSAR